MAEPSKLNLWARQWRAERIESARGDFRRKDIAYQGLKDKSTDYAKSVKMARDVCVQVLALWESSPVDLPDGVPEVEAPLPHWEPCNPGCDPEFNGQRSRYCAKLCQNAREALSAHGVKACERCGGTGVVDDGELDCSDGGIPYENGPIKCVKDCPACGGRRPPTTQEDRWLRDAAKRASTVVAPGKLADGVLGTYKDVTEGQR